MSYVEIQIYKSCSYNQSGAGQLIQKDPSSATKKKDKFLNKNDSYAAENLLMKIQKGGSLKSKAEW